jgi:cytochrome-b5 reductase
MRHKTILSNYIMLRRIISNRAFAPLATLSGGAFAATQTSFARSAETAEEMKPDSWVPLRLISREELTSGERPTHLFTFELSSKQGDLPVASCLLTRAPVGEKKENGENKMVMRPYTPVSAPDAKQLDLAIKVYPDGKLTQHFASLKPGDTLDFKGPIVKLDVADAAKKKAGIGMVAGGTGITPMLQMAEQLLKIGYTSPINLIYCNVSPSDIMLKDKLDSLAKAHANFSVYYMVDAAPKGTSWSGGVGYVTKDILSSNMPKANSDCMVLVCGPPPMMNAISGNKVSPKEQGPLSGLLKDMGYTESQVFKF